MSDNAVAINQIKSLQEAMEHQLVIDCRRFTDIRIKAGWMVRQRSGQVMSAEQFAYHREEWISGKVHPGNPINIIRMYENGHLSNESRWTEAEKARIILIVREIEDWTGVTLPAREGCPYFAHAASMPSDWGWFRCQSLMLSRFDRMRLKCNGYWITEDSPTTIFLECIFQVCINKMVIDKNDPDFDKKYKLQHKYAEFLGLPLHVEFYNPLTFAVAHRVHGYQMLTGWVPNPGGLSDRNDDRNNILIETRTSNYLKANYPEQSYPALKSLMLDVRLPASLVNEQLTPSPYDPRFEGGIGAVSYGDCGLEDDEVEEASGVQDGSDED